MQIGDVDVRVSEVMWFSVTSRLQAKEEQATSSMTIFMRSSDGISEGLAATDVTDEQVEALRYALDDLEPPVASGGDTCFATMQAQTIARGVTLQAICAMTKGHKGPHGFEMIEWKLTQRAPYDG